MVVATMRASPPRIPRELEPTQVRALPGLGEARHTRAGMGPVLSMQRNHQQGGPPMPLVFGRKAATNGCRMRFGSLFAGVDGTVYNIKHMRARMAGGEAP